MRSLDLLFYFEWEKCDCVANRNACVLVGGNTKSVSVLDFIM